MLEFVHHVVFGIDRTTLLVGVASALLVMWLIKAGASRRGLNLPPGPLPLPSPVHYVIGLVTFIRKVNPIMLLGKLIERYGEIVYIEQGPRRMVFLGSLELVKEVLIQHADVTSGREEFWELFECIKYRGGIIFSEGEEWVQHRRFGLAALRNFGLGKKSLEYSINQESRMLREALAEKVGQPLDPFFIINNAVSNIICAITFGRRFEYSDPKFKDMISRINNFVSEHPGVMAHLPAFIVNARRRNLLEVRRHLEEEVKEHQATFDPDDVRDVIDMYLFEIRRAQQAGEKTQLALDKAWPLVFDFFMAGTETTSTTLLWSFLLLAGNPEIQEKVVAEINSVIGHSTAPQYEDRNSMPYTEATLSEVLRFRPIAPNGVPHKATADLKIRGYDIPRGVGISANILYIHHDPKVWGDPEVFRPERFLSEDGKTVIKHEAYMPFGAGRRICMGEQLAKMEMFLFLTNVLQQFKVSIPPGTQPDFGFGHRVTTLLPKAYQVILEEH